MKVEVGISRKGAQEEEEQPAPGAPVWEAPWLGSVGLQGSFPTAKHQPCSRARSCLGEHMALPSENLLGSRERGRCGSGQ